MNYLAPKLLRPGDKVGIVAPARKIDRQVLDRAIAMIKAWGLEVVVGANVFHGDHSYLSSTDAGRLHDLQKMFDDPTLAAVICARGGYGSTRIAENLDLQKFLQSPKWIVGFSDITSLQLLLLSVGFQSIHGTMPVLFSREDSVTSVESLRKVLFEGDASLNAKASSFNRYGSAVAQVIGGNLSLLADSLGTKTEVDTQGKILIIEEIDEYFYKVDRMMVQLRRAGKFDDVLGLAVGHMTDIKNGELKFSERVEEIVLDCVSRYSFPVAFNFPTGHENPNLAWIQGAPAKLVVDETGSTLSFLRIDI